MDEPTYDAFDYTELLMVQHLNREHNLSDVDIARRLGWGLEKVQRFLRERDRSLRDAD